MAHRQSMMNICDLHEIKIDRMQPLPAALAWFELAVTLASNVTQINDELAQWQRSRHRDLAFEDRLRTAIEQHQFALHYQPIIDLRSLDVCAMEALLRWQASDGTHIPPAQFVPVAEATGLIQQLGQWSLREACRQSAAWRQAGIRAMPIAVNLSPCQLRQPDLVESILATLDETGTAPHQIELEITETSLMQDIDRTLPELRRLARSGIHLAIDDFGTGYSSLSYLRRLPITKLKIDQSFVRELQSAPNDATIVSAIIGLAKNLGMTTVAEGVETLGQVEILRSLGCDFCQGFYFSPAQSAATLVPLLTSWIICDRPARSA